MAALVAQLVRSMDYSANPSTMNDSESVDFIRAAVISLVAGESFQACAFSTLSKARST
jgi:hypothetical protein